MPAFPDPNAFLADDFEPGDQFALEIQPDAVYEILDRTDRPGEMIEFQARRSNEGGAEPIEYAFTFPARQYISARRRNRKFTKNCTICEKAHTVEVDTAYSTLNSVVCRHH